MKYYSLYSSFDYNYCFGYKSSKSFKDQGNSMSVTLFQCIMVTSGIKDDFFSFGFFITFD